METTFCELRAKDVINVIDGKRLGHIIDLRLSASGKVLGIIVPGAKRIFKSNNASDNIYILWNDVVKIGEDAILVELCGEKPPCC